MYLNRTQRKKEKESDDFGHVKLKKIRHAAKTTTTCTNINNMFSEFRLEV